MMQTKQITINNQNYSFRYPASPLMEGVIYEIFGKQEYPFLPFLQTEGNVILDIGANIGCTALWFSALYPKATICAFEPAQATFELLQENTRALPNVRTFNYGLFDRDATVKLYKGQSASVTNSMGSSMFNSLDYEEVTLRRVSTVLAELGNGRIPLLKIDTEGVEVAILRDVEHLLNRVDAIFVEYHSEQDRLELDRMLSERYLLYGGKVTHAHRGTFAYVAKDIIATRTDLNRAAISRPRA